MEVKKYKYAIVEKGAKIGEGTSICSFVYIEKGVIIGKNCKIKNGAQLFNGLKLGDNVFIGPGVVFTNCKYPVASRKGLLQQTIVGDNVVIGANSTILSGIIINDNSVVGAGSIVTRDVEFGHLVYGNPAR